jgi:hypothetical protein
VRLLEETWPLHQSNLEISLQTDVRSFMQKDEEEEEEREVEQEGHSGLQQNLEVALYEDMHWEGIRFEIIFEAGQGLPP